MGERLRNAQEVRNACRRGAGVLAGAVSHDGTPTAAGAMIVSGVSGDTPTADVNDDDK